MPDRYKTPVKGEPDWHLPLNQNFDRLERDVEIRDTEANLDQYAPNDGAKFLATDTGVVYLRTGGSWEELPNTGETPRFRAVSNELYASAYQHETLSACIDAALDDLRGGQGRIRVTPRGDGQPWQWGSDLEIVTTDYPGVHIDIDSNVVIEYAGDGVPISFKQEGWTKGRVRAVLEGGRWESTGDPTGWCSLKDTVLARIKPTVVDFDSGDDSTFGVRLENHDRWAESNVITGKIRAGICIDSVTATMTGGSGTNSFHETRLRDLHLHPTNIGIRCRGNWSFCDIHHCRVFLMDDGADAFYLDSGKMSGTSVTSCKVEEPGGSGTGVAVGPNYNGWNAPTFFGGHFSTTNLSRNDGTGNQPVPWVHSGSNSLKINDIVSGATVGFETKAMWPGFEQTVDGVKIGRYIDMDGNPIRNAEHFEGQQLRSSPPSSPSAGDWYIDDGSNTETGDVAMRIHDGSKWVNQN